jgi:hypothetical protein
VLPTECFLLEIFLLRRLVLVGSSSQIPFRKLLVSEKNFVKKVFGRVILWKQLPCCHLNLRQVSISVLFKWACSFRTLRS